MYRIAVSGNVHHALLERVQPLADEVVEYRFAPDAGEAALGWRPGQFISLSVGTQPDGTAILRSYSLANRPGHGWLSLVVRLLPGGPASEWLRTMALGTRVRFTGPMGFFVLEMQHAGDAVFAATGTGIAPLIPMIEELLERPSPGGPGRMVLLWGLREERDLFWQREIADLVAAAGGRLEATTFLSRGGAGWKGARGRITQAIFDAAASLSRPTFYLCGNGAMIREVKAGLVERGVDRKRQIRTEAFFD